MATRKPDIIDYDPKGKWEGGEYETDEQSDSPKTGRGADFKDAMYGEVRTLRRKLRKLESLLSDPTLKTAERYALKQSLKNTEKSLQELAKNSKAEVEFLRNSEYYGQDASRKLSMLAREIKVLKSKPQGQKGQEQLKTLEQTAKHLRDIIGKDVDTANGRMGLAKSLTRVDQMVNQLPRNLQKMFQEQTKRTEELAEMQRRYFEEAREQQRKMDEQQLTSLRTRYDAHQELKESRQRFTDSLKQRALSGLDRVGVGRLNAGNVFRGLGSAYRLQKNYREGKTGLQKWMQTRAVAKGQDPHKLRFGLGRTAETDDSKFKKYAHNLGYGGLLKRLDSDGEAQSAALTQMPLSDGRSGSTPDTDRQVEVQQRSDERLATLLERHVSGNERFNTRLLMSTKDLAQAVKNKENKAANDDFLKAGGVGGILRNIGTLLAESVPAVLAGIAASLPGMVVGLIPALLVALGKNQKEKIEANPQAPEFKDNAYAMKLRGEADSVTQATKMNQQKALKTLPPGTAQQFLQRMDEDKVEVFEGYNRSQLQAMAAGRKPEGMEKFVKIQTAAQKAATAKQFAADDNSDTARMQKRSQNISIPSPGSAEAAPVGAMGIAMSGKAKLQGVAGAGGMLKEGMGSYLSQSSGVDVEHVNPQLQSRISSMAQEYHEKTGKSININSAYRSFDDQQKLYESKPAGMAARPGSSLHNYGLAIDIPTSTANELDKMGLLAKYGLERPIANEGWHIQPKGVSVAAARNGLFSADAPANQGDKQGSMASAKSTSPAVSDASVVTPSNSSSGSSQTAPTASSGSQSGGGSHVGVSQIPTFDSSDGMFLSLNMGVV